MEKILITPKEAGKLLSISENRVRELCRNDPTFPCTRNRNGGWHKVYAQGLAKWIEEKCQNGEAI